MLGSINVAEQKPYQQNDMSFGCTLESSAEPGVTSRKSDLIVLRYGLVNRAFKDFLVTHGQPGNCKTQRMVSVESGTES